MRTSLFVFFICKWCFRDMGSFPGDSQVIWSWNLESLRMFGSRGVGSQWITWTILRILHLMISKSHAEPGIVQGSIICKKHTSVLYTIWPAPFSFFLLGWGKERQGNVPYPAVFRACSWLSALGPSVLLDLNLCQLCAGKCLTILSFWISFPFQCYPRERSAKVALTPQLPFGVLFSLYCCVLRLTSLHILALTCSLHFRLLERWSAVELSLWRAIEGGCFIVSSLPRTSCCQ